MPNKEYKLNTQTLDFEVVATPFRVRLYRLLRKLIIGFILASVVNVVFSYFFYTPKMARINSKNSEMLFKFSILSDKIGAASKKVAEIKHRDNSVYRRLFAADTLSIPEVYYSYPASKYIHLKGDRYTELMSTTWHEIDAMARQLYLESLSLDELQVLSVEKENLAFAVPAIWPIDRRYLTGSIGQFGGRNHPILGRYMMHKGIDLGAKTGTPIYSTGYGVVSEVSSSSTYGLQVVVDHGFGYKTRYAHMSKTIAKRGEEVKRGEIIGEVGSTGRSQAPHLHYEVMYMGQPVDPINYFRKDISEEEFAKILDSAKETIYEILE